MKILIIGFTKLKFMPYLRFYTEGALPTNENHILYWNRDLADEDTGAFSDFTLHEFRRFQKDEVSKISKIGSFIKFRQFSKKLINEIKPDKIIVLHTIPAVILSDILCKKYAGKFILDYRDFTFENIIPFRKKVEKLSNASEITFVSSDAYRKFLPENDKIFTTHNISQELTQNKIFPENYFHKPIRISFWGFVRQEEINKSLISQIGKSSDFELHYYGREQDTAEKLKAFVKEQGYSNVYFHGEYKPEERFEFAKNTDILDNVYFDQNSLMAMGNKFYDGIAFHLPQVFMEGSFMGEIGKQNGIGVSLNPQNADFCEKLKKWYETIDRDKFNSSCDKLLENISKEYENAKKQLTLFSEKC